MFGIDTIPHAFVVRYRRLCYMRHFCHNSYKEKTDALISTSEKNVVASNVKQRHQHFTFQRAFQRQQRNLSTAVLLL